MNTIKTKEEDQKIEYRFEDLFDIDEIQKIQNAFSLAMGVASVITTPDGKPITKPSGFCELCLEIRKTEKGLINCMLSDSVIGKPNPNGPTIQKCLSGNFLDAGSSIVIKDQHICNWLIGQVVEDNTGDFVQLTYADEIGMDRKKYSAGIKKIKHMSFEQFEKISQYLFLNAKYLSEIALKRLELTEELANKKKNEHEINYLSYHDSLTGLYNRIFFEEEINRLDVKRNLPISFIMGDINGLKLINDSFGYQTGNNLLVKVAEVLKESCRADEIISRVGGDEFIIILPKTDFSETERIIERINTNLSGQRINDIEISMSFGYSTKISANENTQTVLKLVEDHLHRNKVYENSSMRTKTINIIMKTLYEKNQREMLHSKRVSEIAKKIGMSMHLNKDVISQIGIIGLMHDIGKIGIDETILNSTQSLSEMEWIEIKKHSEIGHRILSSSDDFSEIAIDVLQHHERWDGNGYPKGLKGHEISLNARIIAIADTYDAMISDRAYRSAFTPENAISEIMRCAGSQFDPEIVEIFKGIPNIEIEN